MKQYGAFAHCYDRMMHDVDYAAWTEYLISFLKEASAKSVLDCACGTGRITIALAKAGYSMIGTDISEDMLMEARSAALQNGLRFLPFVCQDMTALAVHRPVDALICACDGVNYLTAIEDVKAFFSGAYRALKSDGLLLFDVSSAYKLEHVLGNETFTEVTDEYAYVWNNAFDPQSHLCEMDLTFFVKDGTLYQRFSEQHVQRAHTQIELCDLLAESGFAVTGVYDAFTRDPVRRDSERIQFVAKKKEVTI